MKVKTECKIKELLVMKIVFSCVLFLMFSVFMYAQSTSSSSLENFSRKTVKWHVNGNGYEGLLSYTVDTNTDRVTGTLLGTQVEGYLVGRHLVLHRFPKGRTQIWEGWIMDEKLGTSSRASYNKSPFIAGTISESKGTVDGVYPWYGVVEGNDTPSVFSNADPLYNVVGKLDGLRWEIPCASGGNACRAAVQKPSQSTKLGGNPNQMYEVKLRFRGVVEYHTYIGGQKDGLWYTGGRSGQGSYNVYKLEVSDPPQTYYLNADRAGIPRCWLIDYIKNIKVRGGAIVTLSADAQDGSLISNHDDKGKPIIVPGIAPAPKPFNGQFIQMDVISVIENK